MSYLATVPVAKDWKGVSIDDSPIVWLSPEERDLLVAMLREEAEPHV